MQLSARPSISDPSWYAMFTVALPTLERVTKRARWEGSTWGSLNVHLSRVKCGPPQQRTQRLGPPCSARPGRLGTLQLPHRRRVLKSRTSSIGSDARSTPTVAIS